MATPLTRITELFKRAMGQKAPAPAPEPTPEPVATDPEPVTKTHS